MPRPALRLTYTRPGDETAVEFINVHLKSKLLEFPGGRFSPKDESERATVAQFALQRRAAEAVTIREHASDLLQADRHVVVLGDFNDGPHAATTEILYGPIGSQPDGPESSRQGNVAFHRSDKDDGARLFNITLLVAPERRWSRRYAGQNELIDHILVSASLMPRRDGRFQVPEVEIQNEDAPVRWEQPVVDGIEPDHAPVVVRFV
jgi:predicted extracellular nuclease